MQRSYHGENAPSHQHWEAKHRWARLVARWGTTCETRVTLCFAFCLYPLPSVNHASCVRVCVHVCTCACACVCVCACACVCTLAYVRVRVRVCARLRVCVCAHVRVYVRVRVCVFNVCVYYAPSLPPVLCALRVV